MAIAPVGCRRDLNWIYFGLCSLKEAWGILVESLASFGLLFGACLLLALLVIEVRARKTDGKGRFALRASLGFGAWGLVGLSLAFVVRPHPNNCSARRILFGCLCGLCFSCLSALAGSLAWKSRYGRPPSDGACLAAALGLFSVECVIKASWLLTSTVRARPLEREAGQSPCSIAKADFTGASAYVMGLLLLGLVLAGLGLRCPGKRDRRLAAYLFSSACASVVVWTACFGAYLGGERRPRLGARPDAWDDPPLASLLLAQGWVFLCLCLAPWVIEGARGQRQREREVGPNEVYTVNKAFHTEVEDENPINSTIDDVSLNLEPKSIDSEQKSLENSIRRQDPLYRTHFT
ncbi:G-protein coupled receptor family C group 5 member C-like [Leucoraja erinacea]|uniref:G-protein coupled receptor family C group 5 member C-like n=1 Tax=Leucoraja erinaceus TaxID=7782 RepID=UPI0024588F9F|nr:G-protein coupled receptor family C group 5 member C-like [Leucoraja erinacea]XP_055516885.1 G-protein coupled receptor family C group 5 member C-like [Leucoraja erinacea]